MRKPGGTMVAADHNQSVFKLAGFFQVLYQDSNAGIPRGNFSEVIGQVFSYLRDIRKIRRHLTFQLIGIDAPQILTTAFRP